MKARYGFACLHKAHWNAYVNELIVSNRAKYRKDWIGRANLQVYQIFEGGAIQIAIIMERKTQTTKDGHVEIRGEII